MKNLKKKLETINNWKAPGNSGISYDFIKHSGKITKEVILKLMNMCLKKRELPKDWLNGRVPKWFIELEGKLIKDFNSRAVYNSYEFIKEVYEEYMKLRVDLGFRFVIND
ncbi:hypothetical protein RhiirB3_442449 [Rhizophagus irregularis]|nr:hypothetical protein RhiirB3_442449 [Rhizophagus irregularis]